MQSFTLRGIKLVGQTQVTFFFLQNYKILCFFLLLNRNLLLCFTCSTALVSLKLTPVTYSMETNGEVSELQLRLLPLHALAAKNTHNPALFHQMTFKKLQKTSWVRAPLPLRDTVILPITRSSHVSEVQGQGGPRVRGRGSGGTNCHMTNPKVKSGGSQGT